MQNAVCRPSGEIRKEIVLKHAKIFLKNRFPKTVFDLRYIMYIGGKSLKVSWTNGPTKTALSEFVETFQGCAIKDTIIERFISPISFPDQTIMTSWGIDFIILDRKTSF